MTNKKKTDRYYVDNKTLYTDLLRWWTECADAEEAGRERPQVYPAIAEAMMKIVYNLASKYNFSKYPFIEDMVSDALADCVAAVRNYDPHKFTTPFAYFSTVAYFAFLRRINLEKKALVGKYKIAEHGATSLAGQYSHDELEAAFGGILDNQYMKDLAAASEVPDEQKRKVKNNTWRLRKHQERRR